MSISEIKGFVFENYYKRFGFFKIIGYNSVKRLYQKDLLQLANKLQKNVTNPRNAKEHYQSFITKKNKKSVRQSEINTFFLSATTPALPHYPEITDRYSQQYGRLSFSLHFIIQTPFHSPSPSCTSFLNPKASQDPHTPLTPLTDFQ